MTNVNVASPNTTQLECRLEMAAVQRRRYRLLITGASLFGTLSFLQLTAWLTIAIVTSMRHYDATAICGFLMLGMFITLIVAVGCVMYVTSWNHLNDVPPTIVYRRLQRELIASRQLDVEMYVSEHTKRSGLATDQDALHADRRRVFGTGSIDG